MPFIFKGGTSLLLLLEKPRRLSTDIDIIVEPGTDVPFYLEQAAKIYPFRTMEQQMRKGKNNIDKAHFKFVYDSPVQGTQFHIILDIVFEKNHYTTVVKRRVEHPFLITIEPYVEVKVPSIDCILGDKLTAFAPHTTGILLGEGRELEIIKQLYDISMLIDAHENFDDVYTSFLGTVEAELGYRGLSLSPEDVLLDTIDAAFCIAGLGKHKREEHALYMSGVRGLINHIYGERFNVNSIVLSACKTMYFSSCMLKGVHYKKIDDPSVHINTNIGWTKYAALSSLRKLDSEAFAYAVQAIVLLDGPKNSPVVEM